MVASKMKQSAFQSSTIRKYYYSIISYNHLVQKRFSIRLYSSRWKKVQTTYSYLRCIHTPERMLSRFGKSGGKKPSKQESRLLDLLNSSQNANKCGECGTGYPTWASYDLGMFLCGRCASLHRSLGSVSKVKSLTLENWSEGEIDKLAAGGNKRARSYWNPSKVPFPNDDNDKRWANLLQMTNY